MMLDVEGNYRVPTCQMYRSQDAYPGAMQNTHTAWVMSLPGADSEPTDKATKATKEYFGSEMFSVPPLKDCCGPYV